MEGRVRRCRDALLAEIRYGLGELSQYTTDVLIERCRAVERDLKATNSRINGNGNGHPSQPQRNGNNFQPRPTAD